MNQSKIAVRYAKALFLLAKEKNQLEKSFSDIELISNSLKEIEQFGLFLKSPVIKPSAKTDVITKAFKSSVSESTLSFLTIIIQNKREADIEAILRRFIYLYREHKGIISATITTAAPIDEKTRQNLLKMLSDIYKTNVELDVKQDASLIGGFILKAGDQQLDASIASGLKRMRNTLLTEIHK